MKKIVISSGHGKLVQGACGILNEVEEARRVVNRVAEICNAGGVANAIVFHDDLSTNQSDNLEAIVRFHNEKKRDLDISVHFNAYVETNSPMGTEVLYVTQDDLANEMSEVIAEAGDFKNRGGKERGDLYFLNKTEMPALLLEVCFVDSKADTDLYQRNFEKICQAIAEEFGAGEEEAIPLPDESLRGKASTFGGPDDKGVAPDEGLAFIFDVKDAPHLFLAHQPPNTTGLARRLNPRTHYIACRWNYDQLSKEELLKTKVLVKAVKTGRSLEASPADWGPNESTGRVADLSPGLMEALGIVTDDEVIVTLKKKEEKKKEEKVAEKKEVKPEVKPEVKRNA